MLLLLILELLLLKVFLEIPLTIRRVKYQKNNLILQFAELSTIEEAEALKNTILYADRADLGELPEGVYYIADLIGMTVQDEAGEKIGTIKEVLQTGANDVYVVRREEKKDLLIPVIEDAVKGVDLEKRTVTVTLLDGLEDL